MFSLNTSLLLQSRFIKIGKELEDSMSIQNPFAFGFYNMKSPSNEI